MRGSWSRYTVGELVKAHYSGPSPTCEERNVRSAGEWGLLKTTAVTWEAGWDWTKHKVPPRQYWNQPAMEVQPGDVVVTKAGPRHRVGVVAHVDQTPPHIMVSGKMVGLRPDHDLVVSAVLAGVLATAGPQKFLDHRTTGMAESQVNFANAVLLKTPLDLPPLPEQRRIAEILDTLDEAIRKTEQVIAKLQQMKQGLLHDLLTRGIDEHGELRDPERHPEQFKDSPLGRIPRGWEVKRVGELVRTAGGLIQTGPFGSQLHAHEYVGEGVPVVMPQDIQGDDIDLTNIARITERKARELGRHRVQANDAVFSRRGDLSRCVAISDEHVGWLCGTGSLLVRLPESRLTSEWLTSVYRHDLGQRQVLAQAVGSTMVNLNGKILANLRIPVPPLHEQHEAVERVLQTRGRLASERSSLSKLRTLKHGLMDDLLTGRVRVPAPEEATA